MSIQVGESATNLRYQCLQLMLRLHTGGGSLTRLLPQAATRVASSEQPQLQAWCFGWCRWSQELTALIDPLLKKPLKSKDLDVYLLMQLGVFQLRHSSTATHAAVDETVKVVKRLKKPWARGLVNAVLRHYQRQQTDLESGLTLGGVHSHPAWMLERFRKDWPAKWEAICQQNNVQAPMCLRVNRLQSDQKNYQHALTNASMPASTVEGAPEALLLDSPVTVSRLPDFEQGHVSVQDAAAQLTSGLFAQHLEAGGRLLDACAAPGGKTAHAAESEHFSHITAIDRDAERLVRVHENLQRLQLQDKVDVRQADALMIDQWWDGKSFNAVLLDAPCSGTGVIRRHPDIKVLRREDDIASLVATQKRLLEVLWQTLGDNGVLLYATCSVLKDENEHQVNTFLQNHADAHLLDGMLQIFPGERSMDGFFYAAIRKSPS